MSDIIKSIILGIIEGITEWLPISSTGHLILADEFIRLDMSEEFMEMFNVVIQLGAILAVVVIFWKKLWPFTLDKTKGYSYITKGGGLIKKDIMDMWFKVIVAMLPAAVIGAGLSLLLYVTGGSRRPSDYLLIVVSILCMSVFFSVHYLTIYYLLQPYNAGTEMKSGTYGLICFATYLVCFCMMQVRIPLFLFGLACILFCVIYCAVACLLVYRLAPKTFKLRP